MSKRWIAVGALVLMGAYWAAVRLLQVEEVEGDKLAYIAHALGAFATGAGIALFAPVRPTREPLIAAVLGIAMLAVIFIGMPHPQFSWVAARSSMPWLIAAMIAAGSAGCAVAGATLGRRAKLQATGPVAIVTLSFLICSVSWSWAGAW